MNKLGISFSLLNKSNTHSRRLFFQNENVDNLYSVNETRTEILLAL